MPEIIPREDANLPQVPSFIDHRSLSSWAGIRIHHTGGSFSTWRAVHDWQTEGRPRSQQLAYIGYSFGIADGEVTELRGFRHHPAHDFINTHLGVVFGGNYQNRLPTRADLDALVWFIGEAERRCDKKLPISTHREVGQTACPGDELHRWVKQTLPGRLEEEDMTKEEVEEAVIAALQRQRKLPDGRTRAIGWLIEWGYVHAAGARRLLKAQQPLLEAAAQGQPMTADQVATVAAEVAAVVEAGLADEVADELGERIKDDDT